MSNPNTFMYTYAAQIQNFVNLLEALRLMNDQLAQDPTIVTRYFTITSGSGSNAQNAQGQTPRSDIVAADVTNAEAALNQVIFAFDSGNPTQKSQIYKMLP